MEVNEPAKPINVHELHEDFKWMLEQRVAWAFNHRRKVNLTADGLSVGADLEKGAAFGKQVISLPDNASINFGNQHNTSLEFHMVSVSNAHDYRLLIEATVRLLINEGVLDKDGFDNIVEANLRHEFAHHVPALGKLNVEYCVEFVEDEDRRIIGFIPAIRLVGRTTLAVFKDIASAPDSMSDGDKAVLGIANV